MRAIPLGSWMRPRPWRADEIVVGVVLLWAVCFGLVFLVLGGPDAVLLPLVAGLLGDLGTNVALDEAGARAPLLTGFGFDLQPIVAAVLVGLVGQVFRRGQRMQRDLEGLV